MAGGDRKDAESTFAVPLLESVRERGFRAEIAIMDMGYDHEAIYEQFEAHDCHPVIPLRETPAVKAGKHLPPTCAHGTWTFAGYSQLLVSPPSSPVVHLSRPVPPSRRS
jgi:hypothetical protein